MSSAVSWDTINFRRTRRREGFDCHNWETTAGSALCLSFTFWCILRFVIQCRLLKAIDSLAENFPLSANETKRVLRSNSIVIQTNRIHVESFTGLSFDGDQQESGRLTTRIALPRTLFDEVSIGDADARVGFTLYRNNKLFRMIPEPGAKKEGAAVLNSMAISASVKGIKINNLKNPVSIQLQLRSPTEGGASTCVFWDFTAAGASLTSP